MPNILEELAKAAGYKYKNKAEAIAVNHCVKCGLDIEGRILTHAGMKEYCISGLCEICFDAIFENDGE
jgi:hypothetical protein